MPVNLFAVSGMTVLLNSLVIVVTLVLMFVILIQRGKGGGLVGALGGPGGSSAFGSRAGDQFTKITLWIATVWILLIMVQSRIAQNNDRLVVAADSPAAVEKPTSEDVVKPATDAKPADTKPADTKPADTKPAEGKGS